MSDRTHEEAREEQRHAYGDAVYEAWRRGLNPDDVRSEDVEDGWYETHNRHCTTDYAVRQVQHRADRRHEHALEEQDEQRRQQEREQETWLADGPDPNEEGVDQRSQRIGDSRPRGGGGDVR